METIAEPTWDDLRVLLALHRHRSFLRAGQALGVSTSTAARRIETLERTLGRPLVHRSSAGTSLEPGALELVALAEQLELGLKAARRDEGDEGFSGTVRLSMGEGWVRPATRLLAELRRKHQGLQFEILSENRVVDLARREADLGIRKVRSSSPVLIERAVGRLPFALFAAREYLDRRLRGTRLRQDELARHDFVGFERALNLPQTRWLEAHGARRFSVRSNSDLALEEAAVQGQGLHLMAAVPGYEPAGLVKLDFDGELPATPVYLAFHRELRQVPRFRLVIGTLEGALRHALK